MTEQGRRIGLNEAIFRQVNERLEDVNRAFGSVTDTIEIVCECGNLDCDERILMSIAHYEALRSDPRQFAVVRGHETAGVEAVVERRSGYDVVRKREGDPARLADETDPRSR
jgi:hypothetical protein